MLYLHAIYLPVCRCASKNYTCSNFSMKGVSQGLACQKMEFAARLSSCEFQDVKFKDLKFMIF